MIFSVTGKPASLLSSALLDDGTFRLRLTEPLNYVEFLLGGSNGVAGAIMREKEALTDPYKPVTEIVGSGPFRFNKGAYEAGSRLVYERFAGYRPRRTRRSPSGSRRSAPPGSDPVPISRPG